MEISMNVNGDDVTREVEPRTLLVHFIRDHLGLTGTHWGCDTSNCGTCVVWVDGEPVKSCTTLAAMTGGHEVRTVEGMEVDGVLDPVQEGFHPVPRSAVRVLYSRDDAHRARPARPQSRTRPMPRSVKRSAARSAVAPAIRPSSAPSSGRPPRNSETPVEVSAS